MAETKTKYGEVHWNFHTQAVYKQIWQEIKLGPHQFPGAFISFSLWHSPFCSITLIFSLWCCQLLFGGENGSTRTFSNTSKTQQHQTSWVLLCFRKTGNVLRITTFALSSGSSQTRRFKARFVALSIQSSEFKWHVHKCYTFRNPYNGMTWAFHCGGIPQVCDVPFQPEPRAHMDEHLFPTPSKATQAFLLWTPKKTTQKTKRSIFCSLYTFKLLVCARTASPTSNCHQHKCQILYYKQWVTSGLMTKKMLYGADSKLAQHLDHLLF